jgi:hypothetical protein
MISYSNWPLACNCEREFAVVLGGTYGVPRYTVHVGRLDIVDYLVHLVFLLYFDGKCLTILDCLGVGQFDLRFRFKWFFVTQVNGRFFI